MGQYVTTNSADLRIYAGLVKHHIRESWHLVEQRVAAAYSVLELTLHPSRKCFVHEPNNLDGELVQLRHPKELDTLPKGKKLSFTTSSLSQSPPRESPLLE